MENIAAKTTARIAELIAAREKELEALADKERIALDRAAEAEQKMQSATASADFKSYEKAKADKLSAIDEAQMYTERREQLCRNNFLTEQESDTVIDSVLEYEKALDEEYKSAAAAIIAQLATLDREYSRSVEEAENAITLWTSRIHANHRAERTVYANGTNRSETPVPVHFFPYRGCEMSKSINRFLSDRNIAPLAK